MQGERSPNVKANLQLLKRPSGDAARSPMSGTRRLRHLQSLAICHPGGDPMLHEQWKEQTFAAGAATNHHRTEGVRYF